MTELYDLIERLTHDHQVQVTRHGEYVRTRTDPPLLTALEKAVVSSVGRGGETRSRQERVQLNVAASELSTAITRQVRRWARNAGYRPPHTGWPTTRLVLRRWYAIKRTAQDLDPYIATLAGWVRNIDTLLIDPPRKFTLNAPCPLCGATKVIDPDGNLTDALHVTDRDPIHTSEIACHNCEAIWNGIDGARALRIAIDERVSA